MLKLLSRLLLAGWFVGMLVLAVRGMPVQGQTPEEEAKFLPLMSRYAPLTSDPWLRNYVGLMVANGDETDPDYEIYTVRGDGSEPRRLTNNEVDDTGAVWSADGAKIAFVRRTGASNAPAQAMMMNADGSQQQVLLDNLQVDEIRLTWAPSRRDLLLYLVVDHPNTHTQLVLLKADGTVRTLFDSATGDGYWVDVLGWSPDGNYVHYLVNRKLYVYSLATHQPVVIDEDLNSNSPPFIQWLPNSSAFLYAENAGSFDTVGYWVVPDGSERRQLFQGAYTPRGILNGGTSVLLTGWMSGQALYTMPVAGGEITAFSNGDVWFGGINPLGSAVLYQSIGDRKLWLHPVDGEPSAFVTPECAGWASYCLLNGTTWAPDGSKIIYELYEGDGDPRSFGYSSWLLSLESPMTNVHIHSSRYGLGRQYLPSSSTWVGLNIPAYPFPNSEAAVLNSNDLSTTPLSVSEGQSQSVTGWRYLP